MKTYHYLFADPETGEVKARVRYTLTGGFDGAELDLVVSETIPAGFPIGPREELALRHNAAMLDLDEAEAEHEGRMDEEPYDDDRRSIHWGVKG